MTDTWSRWNVPQVILGVLVITVILTLVVSGFSSAASFGPYNLGWDGTSDFREMGHNQNLDLWIVRDAGRYADFGGDGGVAVILAPESAYSATDVEDIRAFVESGGRVVVAGEIDRQGAGLLDALGVESRFDGRLLRDEREHFQGPALPFARPVSDHSLTGGVESLSLNHGTAIEPGASTVLFETSEYAYLDTDGDGELDETEQVASYPVVTIESVGEGEVIVIGDSSIFINTMLGREDNSRFAEELINGKNNLYLDVSHSTVIPPLVELLLVVRSSLLAHVLLGAVLLGAVSAWMFAPRLDYRHVIRKRTGFRHRDHSSDSKVSVPRDALVEHLENRYPELGHDRIREIVKEVKPRDGQEGLDD